VRYGELQGALDAGLAEAGIAIDYGCRVKSVAASDALVEVSVDVIAERANGNGAGGTANDGSEPHPAPPAERHRARLVVVADGSGESLPDIHRRKIDYRQQAVIGIVESDAMQPGVAYERFTPDGPTALLPYESRYALIRTATPEQARELLALGDADF